MYAIKLELKVNNKERSYLAGCAGLKRFTYNFGLSLLIDSWQFEDLKASDSKRIDTAKKVFNNELKTLLEFQWINDYPSTIYQSAFQNLKDAFSRWRKGQNELPVFKTKKGKQSFTVYKTSGLYPEKGKPPLPFTNRQVLCPGKKINIPGLGE